jgi:hypothetical protein
MRTRLTSQRSMSSAMSRRQLGLGTIGSTLIGFGSAVAAEPPEKRRPLRWSFAPVPVQGGTPGLGGAYHVFGPMTASPDQEPSSISNFKGFAGYALISGNVTRTNIKIGEQQYLPFTDTDMRFMTGTFKGTDGQEHPGTFAFV